MVMKYTRWLFVLALLFGIDAYAGSWKLVGCGLVWEGDVTGTTQSCYNRQEFRSASVLSTCRPPLEKSGALCYEPCREGYNGVGPVCWQNCPAGYHDDGATCRRDVRIIGADNSDCPWYDKCGLTFARGCSRCPEGWNNDGCTCRIDTHIFGKDAYWRGAGSPLSCAPGQEQIGALCYGNCRPGWRPDGVLCTEIAPTCTTVPVREPPDFTKLRQYCFRMTQNSPVRPCFVATVMADTLENARALAQCECTNCSVTQIDCAQQTGACP
jgi:hypothetical protein